MAASVREIGADAFSGCKSLRRVTFAAGSQLQTMGDRCFQGSGIEEISVPAVVKVIGRDAFRYCARLKSVAFQEGCALETIESGCFRCSSLTEIVVPRAVRELGNCAFRDCRGLKSVVFQDGSALKRIGCDCFSKTGIDKIAIPSGVSVGDRAFFACRVLAQVDFREGAPKSVGKQCFCRCALEMSGEEMTQGGSSWK